MGDRHHRMGRCDGMRNVDVQDCTVTSGWPRETSNLLGIDAATA
jgi:hypothetical protein